MNVVSSEYGISVFYNILAQLHTDGFNISRENINSVEFKDIAKDVGHFWLEDTKLYNFTFNSALLKPNKLRYLSCAIYHELIHAIQYNEAFLTNIIRYNKVADTIECITQNQDLFYNVVYGFDDHTLFWYDMAKKVNTKYNLIPKVTAYLSNEDLENFLMEMFEKKLTKKNMHIDRTVGGLTLDEIDELIERQKQRGQLNEIDSVIDWPVENEGDTPDIEDKEIYDISNWHKGMI